MKTVLTIAGYDPSSGAGITADLAVFAAHGLNGTSAITALTVQSTAGVRSSQPVDPELLRATLDCLEADLPADGIKIGMLGSESAVKVVADYLESIRGRRRAPVVVLDTLLRSSSGKELLNSPGVRLMTERLFGLVDWVTPNVEELSALSGIPIKKPEDIPRAAAMLQSSFGGGRLGVFATGGHLDPPDDFLLLTEGEHAWLRGRRVETRATHGTGCALSSAFLCELVSERLPGDAAREAKAYVEGALRHAVETGSGPCAMNHLWKLRTGPDLEGRE